MCYNYTRMSVRFSSLILPLLLLLFLAGALGLYIFKNSQNNFLPKAPDLISTPSPTKEPVPTVLDKKTQQELVGEARADLSGRLDISIAEITTKEIESITWSDTSLGCPEPGKFYAQVLTPGYRVVLEAEEEEYAYHTSLNNIKPCETPTNPPGSPL